MESRKMNSGINNSQNVKRNRELSDVVHHLSPLKKLKMSSKAEKPEDQKNTNSPSKETRSKNGFNFLTSCQQVSTNEYFDVKERLGILHPPECCYSTVCAKHNGSQNPFQVLPYEREAFRIDIKSGMWCEALDVFRAIIKHNKFPSVDIVLDILNMIINVDNNASGFSSQYVIKRCQNVIKLLFTVHPPCSETVRTFYQELLISPKDIMLGCSLYTDIYDPKQDLFKYLINILQTEILSSSSCSNQEEIITNLNNELGESLVFEKLKKCERIQRLVLIVDLLVDLLERDLSIWISKHFQNPRKYIVRKQKPLLAWILWQNSVIHTGLVNNNCRQIFQILISLIESKYSLSYVNVFKRLLNLIFQTFYLCGNASNEFYPNIRNHCNIFATELYNLIKDKYDANFILIIVDNVEPKQLRYLLSRNILQTIMKSSETNFILLIRNIFKYRSWVTFEKDLMNDNCLELPISRNITVEKLHNHGLKYYYMRLLKEISLDSDKISFGDDYKNKTKKTKVSTFLRVVHFSFVNFLLTFNIVKIKEFYENLRNNGTSEEIHKPFPLSEECYKEYRLIFSTLKVISVHYSEIKEECPYVYESFRKIAVL